VGGEPVATIQTTIGEDASASEAADGIKAVYPRAAHRTRDRLTMPTEIDVPLELSALSPSSGGQAVPTRSNP
jgi:hypothetical protein